MMEEQELRNMVADLRRCEAKKREYSREIDAIKERLRAEFDERGVGEIVTGRFIVRCKEVVTERFDTKLFKEQQPKAYAAYCIAQVARRITVTG